MKETEKKKMVQRMLQRMLRIYIKLIMCYFTDLAHLEISVKLHIITAASFMKSAI